MSLERQAPVTWGLMEDDMRSISRVCGRSARSGSKSLLTRDVHATASAGGDGEAELVALLHVQGHQA